MRHEVRVRLHYRSGLIIRSDGVVVIPERSYVSYRDGIPYTRTRRMKVTAGSLDSHGYLRVTKQKEVHKIHRLVAEAFVQNPDNKMQVNHINGDKTDNRVENLEWVTHRENIQHAYDIGLITGRRGTECNLCKLSDKEVVQIYILAHESSMTQRDIAVRFDIDQSMVSNIKLGKRWSHLTGHGGNDYGV